MTYCTAIAIDAGLVFVSDSRTNAGVDQIATYSKMHTFAQDDRKFVLLSSGNLATTQSVLAQLRRDTEDVSSSNLFGAQRLSDAADFLGSLIREQGRRHSEAFSKSGSVEATFILGGQIRGQEPRLYLVYPQGNFITTSRQTLYLQVGETKYGKAVLDRIVEHDMSLDDAALCALVSMDSTMRSNVTVGPPIELLAYQRDSFSLDRYRRLDDDDPYLLEIKRGWNEKLVQAFRELPSISWPQQWPSRLRR